MGIRILTLRDGSRRIERQQQKTAARDHFVVMAASIFFPKGTRGRQPLMVYNASRGCSTTTTFSHNILHNLWNVSIALPARQVAKYRI